MKVLHTADWHFGESRNVIPDYLERQVRVARGIFRIAQREECDVVVLAGDLLHPFRKVQDGQLWYEVYSKEKDALLDVLLQADKIGCQILLLNGNHDLVHDQLTLMHFIKLLVDSGKLKNVHIAEFDPEIFDIEVDGVVYNFGMIPYSHTMDSAATINGWADVPNLICVGHEYLAGAVTDTKYCKATGTKLPILPNVLAYMWGDIHKHQTIQNVEHAVYCGAPLQHTFGDKPKKGVVLWDISPEGVSWEFKKLKSKKLVTVHEGEEIPEDAYVRVIATRSDTDLPDNCVKVEIDFEEAVPIEIDDDIWQGLPEILAQQGLPEDRQHEAINLVKSLVNA